MPLSHLANIYRACSSLEDIICFSSLSAAAAAVVVVILRVNIFSEAPNFCACVFRLAPKKMKSEPKEYIFSVPNKDPINTIANNAHETYVNMTMATMLKQLPATKRHVAKTNANDKYGQRFYIKF